MAIDALLGGIQTRPLPPVGPQDRPPGTSFGRSLAGMVGAVEAANTQANQAVGQMLDGTGDVHEAMIALQRADLTLQFSVQVRNKLVQAYQEIMRMPV
jgi:flagellar hook-basal body complex protein FliE